MIDRDYDAFVAEFRRLSSALNSYKQSPTEALAKADAYFHALKRLPLDVVIAKADRWLATETKMPKPAEWAGIMVQRGRVLQELTSGEVAEWLRADQLGYEDAPCSCEVCIEAGVSEFPLRFVPEVEADGRDRHVRLGERIVTAGHWAHGWELGRWYAAKAKFWADMRARGFRTNILQNEGPPRHARGRRKQFVPMLETKADERKAAGE